MLVTAEWVQENLLRLRGILEDRIYAMEIQMEVRLPEGVISSIRGVMKRYTTPVCPKAVDVLQKAVGVSLREPGWISRVNREIGRQGCQHFAEILVECGRCLNQARMSHDLGETLNAQPSTDPAEFTRTWVQSHPEVQGSCLARPKG
ncbi:MAG: DUF2889 domain-containing protein [Planctomycetaceae bacterium]